MKVVIYLYFIVLSISIRTHSLVLGTTLLYLLNTPSHVRAVPAMTMISNWSAHNLVKIQHEKGLTRNQLI